MVIWILFAALTAAAVMAVLWPLSRRHEEAVEGDPEAQFYRDQVAEIERDAARGLLSPVEAEAARAEAGRRLLRAASRREGGEPPLGEPALRRRRAASTLALSVVPLLALALYGAFGSPQLPAQPLSARAQEVSASVTMADAVAQVEAHLAKNPEDGRGWEVLAPVYLRSGRGEEAARAYSTAARLLGESPSRLAGLGEALVAAREGVVSADARSAFERTLALDPGNVRARFYLALAAGQDGDAAKARQGFEALLKDAPADASWRAQVQDQIARFGGAPGAPAGEAAEAVAALPPAERMGAIRGMVEGLSARLEAGGGTADEWARLVRSHAVLGERDKAAAAVRRARTALDRDQAGIARIDALARELDLAGESAKP